MTGELQSDLNETFRFVGGDWRPSISAVESPMTLIVDLRDGTDKSSLSAATDHFVAAVNTDTQNDEEKTASWTARNANATHQVVQGAWEPSLYNRLSPMTVQIPKDLNAVNTTGGVRQRHLQTADEGAVVGEERERKTEEGGVGNDKGSGVNGWRQIPNYIGKNFNPVTMRGNAITVAFDIGTFAELTHIGTIMKKLYDVWEGQNESSNESVIHHLRRHLQTIRAASSSRDGADDCADYRPIGIALGGVNIVLALDGEIKKIYNDEALSTLAIRIIYNSLGALTGTSSDLVPSFQDLQNEGVPTINEVCGSYMPFYAHADTLNLIVNVADFITLFFLEGKLNETLRNANDIESLTHLKDAVMAGL